MKNRHCKVKTKCSFVLHRTFFNFCSKYVRNCRAADIQCWFLNLILMMEKVTSSNWFVKAFLVSWELFERNQYLVRFPPLLLLMLLNKTIPKTCFNCDWEQSLIADPSLGLKQCSKFSMKYRFRTLYVRPSQKTKKLSDQKYLLTTFIGSHKTLKNTNQSSLSQRTNLGRPLEVFKIY